jgi:hypothetical protein
MLIAKIATATHDWPHEAWDSGLLKPASWWLLAAIIAYELLLAAFQTFS